MTDTLLSPKFVTTTRPLLIDGDIADGAAADGDGAERVELRIVARRAVRGHDSVRRIHRYLRRFGVHRL